MKPPNLSSMLARFDCSALDVLSVRRFLGYTLDERTGRRIDGGYAALEGLTAPYSIVSVEGDQAVIPAEWGDRYRDPRWLWSRQSFAARRDPDAPGGESAGDLIVNEAGETFEIVKIQDDQAITGFRGYLLARRAG